MNIRPVLAAAVGLSLLAAGCESMEEELWPSLSGGNPAGSSAATPGTPAAGSEAAGAPAAYPALPPRSFPDPAYPDPTYGGQAPADAPAPWQQAQQQAPQQAPLAPPPARPADSAFTQIEPAPPFQPTGTFVGKKVDQLRGDLARLQAGLQTQRQRMLAIQERNYNASQNYHRVVAAMNGKLQLGTTPGNPVLVRQWNEAQQNLEAIAESLNQMNEVSSDIAGDAGLAAFLLDSVRATFALSGAIDEDHRQLRILEDQVNQTVVVIDRLLNQLSEDVNRQSAYVSNERRNMTTLSLAVKNGELYGTSLVNRAFAQSQAIASSAAQGAGPQGGDRPLVVIRFDRPDVPFQQALYNAVSRALERKPNASFDLVAVSPNRGTPAQVALATTQAKRHAESVLRTLADMGLPGNRVKLSATSSGTAETNEVHIYVR